MDDDEQEKPDAEQVAMTEQLRASVVKLGSMLDAILPGGVQYVVLLHHPDTNATGMVSTIEREFLQKLMEAAFERWGDGEGSFAPPPSTEQH